MSEQATINQLVNELVKRGSDDWVHAPEVAWVVKSLAQVDDTQAIIDMSVDLIRLVLEQGLMVVGDVGDGGFFEWDSSNEDSVRKIERAWRELARLPELGELFWLANTDRGDRYAEDLFGAGG